MSVGAAPETDFHLVHYGGYITLTHQQMLERTHDISSEQVRCYNQAFRRHKNKSVQSTEICCAVYLLCCLIL